MTAHASPPVTDDDRARIAQVNRTDVAFPDDVTLSQLLDAQALRHRSRAAVVCDRANRLAAVLRAEGVGPGDVVALMVERSVAMIVGIFAVLKAGAAYLPIAADSPPERLAYVLENGGVRVLLVHGKTAHRARFGGRVIDLDARDLYRGPAALPDPAGTSRDLAYVIYTSGSTGKPKGVMIEHRSLVNRLHWMQDAYPIAPGDVILQKTPYSFDVSVWELFWWALRGATLCLLRPGGEWNPVAILETIREHRVTVLHFVPSMLNVFLEYLDGKPDAAVHGLASVRRVFASGEALTPTHVRKFNDIWGGRTGARLTNLYGPTEATVDVSFFDCPAHNDLDLIPIGRPIHNTRFHVLRDGKDVGIGETGELCIAGVGLARGYLNNPVLTAEKFTDHPLMPGERIYRTGDLVRWLPDGALAFLGREDHQVKIRGLRIELGEIENTIMTYPGVGDAAVVVKTYSENVILIVAYLVCRADLNVEDLTPYLKRHLPDYMIPHRFERIDRMPVTASGKTDRRALPEPVHARPA
jgi:amino acid adenylation domain-containing protein